MGELLTVTALGGACFGLPTTMVSERERGVWRRYRLAPVRDRNAARRARSSRATCCWCWPGCCRSRWRWLIGMPLPNHPLDLLDRVHLRRVRAAGPRPRHRDARRQRAGGAGAGAMHLPADADHRRRRGAADQPAGVGAARLGVLPRPLRGRGDAGVGHRRRPRRDAIQPARAAADRRWRDSSPASGCSAGTRSSASSSAAARRWVGVALAAWAAVGLLAEARGRIGPVAIIAEYTPPAQPDERLLPRATPRAAAGTRDHQPAADAGAASAAPIEARRAHRRKHRRADAGRPAPEPRRQRTAGHKPPAPAPPPPAATAKPPAQAVDRGSARAAAARARVVAAGHAGAHRRGHVRAAAVRLGRGLADRAGRRADRARSSRPSSRKSARRLVTWGPAQVADPVQRVRNLLYVAAVPDVFQIPLERYVPHVVFERLQGDVPKDDLIKILFWVATHPAGGDDSAVDDLRVGRHPGQRPGRHGPGARARDALRAQAAGTTGREDTAVCVNIPSSRSQLPRRLPISNGAIRGGWGSWELGSGRWAVGTWQLG